MSGPDRPVAIVTAIPEELDAILSRTRDVRRDPYRFFVGRLGATAVVLAATGDGLRRAARGAAALCDVHRPRAFVGMGVAGALTDELTPFDILVARRVIDASSEAPAPDGELSARALALPGSREAALVTARGPVVSRGAREALAASSGETGPAAVDMESAAWAREASDRRIPYAILRVISDGAADELPGYLSECMDSNGSIRRSSVALRALTQPGSIRSLLKMRSRVREASARLAAFVEHLLAKGV